MVETLGDWNGDGGLGDRRCRFGGGGKESPVGDGELAIGLVKVGEKVC